MTGPFSIAMIVYQRVYHQTTFSIRLAARRQWIPLVIFRVPQKEQGSGWKKMKGTTKTEDKEIIA